MQKLSVPDMHCAHCVARIGKALEELGVAHQINLEQKTVLVDAKGTALEEVLQALDDLGFGAQVIAS